MAERESNSSYRFMGENTEDMVESNFYRFPALSHLAEDEGPESEKKVGFRKLDLGGGPRDPAAFTLSFASDEAEEKSSEIDMAEEVERIREMAYAEGFSEGERAGAQSEKVKFQETLETLNQGLAGLASERSHILAEAERQAVELGIRIARKILCREVSIDETIILRTLQEALRKGTADHKAIHVRVHPSDLEVIHAAEDDLPVPSGKRGEVIFESDEAICRGECVIETDFGLVDARFESQMDAVEESLRLALDQNGPVGGVKKT